MTIPDSAALSALSEDPSSAGLVMDFDGVLSPIIDDPAAAAMPATVAADLERIAAGIKVVALLSGRPLAFLRERATIPGVQLLGSYGVERFLDGSERVHPGVAEWADPVKVARERLHEEFAGAEGIRVEDKLISVAVHWRLAPDQDAAAARVREVTDAVADATGLHREPGKLVVELRPPLEMDKGQALRSLVDERSVTAVAYAGDDLGDLPAFAVARELDGHGLVVDHGAETDPRLLAAGTERFSSTEEFATWLAALADTLTPNP